MSQVGGVDIDTSNGHPMLQLVVRDGPAGASPTLFNLTFDLTTQRLVAALAQPGGAICLEPDYYPSGDGRFYAAGYAAGRQTVFGQVSHPIKAFPPISYAKSGAWLTFAGDGAPPTVGTYVTGGDKDTPPLVVRASALGVFEWRDEPYSTGFGSWPSFLTLVRWGGSPVPVYCGKSVQLALGTGGEVLIFDEGKTVGWSPSTGQVLNLLDAPFVQADSVPMTDGNDIVWLRRPSAGDPAVVMMVAPYTLDPAGVVAGTRVVKKDEVPDYDDPQQVIGCGFAAVKRSKPKRVEIVQLSDGATWQLPDAPAGALNPLHIDCNHVTLSVQNKGEMSFARVRLDSLGTPTPAQ